MTTGRINQVAIFTKGQRQLLLIIASNDNNNCLQLFHLQQAEKQCSIFSSISPFIFRSNLYGTPEQYKNDQGYQPITASLPIFKLLQKLFRFSENLTSAKSPTQSAISAPTQTNPTHNLPKMSSVLLTPCQHLFDAIFVVIANYAVFNYLVINQHLTFFSSRSKTTQESLTMPNSLQFTHS
jgi:hypothetical protein